MKIFSWNVNGLRAVLKKGAIQDFIKKENPDILCLQEIKCRAAQVDYIFQGYKVFWNSAKKPGYSGTATLVKRELLKHGETFSEKKTSDSPDFYNISDSKNSADLSAIKNFSNSEHVVKMLPREYYPRFSNSLFTSVAEEEGRILTLDFQDFYLINVYVPNSKPDLARLDFRFKDWDINLNSYIKALEKEKPVIICGDFNAAHKELDIARPKTNHHAAGFTDEERQGITNYISSGLIDTFRKKHPDIARYTWWSHWGHARENNVGWRIDYFFISESLEKNLKNAEIYEHYMGSDHCPISIEMEF